MNKEEKIKEIINLKNEVDSIVHKKYHYLAQKYGLTLEQFHLLNELDELKINLEMDEKNTAPTVGQLAKTFNNSQNTISERVTRLENKNLVMKVKDKISEHNYN